MTLKEKLEVINNYDDQDPHQTFMTIADEYAIEFAEWTSYKYKYLDSKGWFANSFELETGLFKTSKQLLEIFKKEKGL